MIDDESFNGLHVVILQLMPRPTFITHVHTAHVRSRNRKVYHTTRNAEVYFNSRLLFYNRVHM